MSDLSGQWTRNTLGVANNSVLFNAVVGAIVDLVDLLEKSPGLDRYFIAARVVGHLAWSDTESWPDVRKAIRESRE